MMRLFKESCQSKGIKNLTFSKLSAHREVADGLAIPQMNACCVHWRVEERLNWCKSNCCRFLINAGHQQEAQAGMEIGVGRWSGF